MSTPTPADRASSLRCVALVASREIGTRVASRAWRVTTALLLVVVVGGSLIAHLVGPRTTAYTVATTPASAVLAGPIDAVARSLGVKVRLVPVETEAAGRSAVAAGTLDAVVTGTANPVPVVVDKRLDPALANVLTLVARELTTAREVIRLGGDPAAFGAQVAAARLDLQRLSPQRPYDDQHVALGVIAGILIFIALQMNGTQLAQGVVEEKSTRVVELLLSTIRPWELMAGKVLGIGALGLLQLAVLGSAGLAVNLAVGTLTLSVGSAVGTLAWVVVWFVLGFTAYALAMAAAAALVSRQEDVQVVILPVSVPLIVAYVLGVAILPQDPQNPWCRVLSLLPPFAPSMMPIRLAVGGAPLADILISLALMLATIPVLAYVAGRVYRNAVVRTGVRVSLGDAFSPR